LERRSLLYVNLYASFSKQVDKGIIIIGTKADKSPYLGIHQHLGTQDAWRMSAVNSATLKADTVKGGLYDYVLLSMNTPTYFVPCPRRDVHLVSKTA